MHCRLPIKKIIKNQAVVHNGLQTCEGKGLERKIIN
jgi:hypothetical protein